MAGSPRAPARELLTRAASPRPQSRSSPRPYAALEKAEQNFFKDTRYKKYVLLVERNLQLFDSVSEWADFIAFLSRLVKSFQAYPQFPIIPHKVLVGKRLAQCLNPALPSGVHQKALEVYSYIFDTIGTSGLERDLHIYSIGLFPFLQYASTSARDTLLRLYDQHFLSLRRRLRPITKALIMAILPGLEDEQAETYDRCLMLLERLSQTVDKAYFFQCIWLVLITQSSLRAPAINFISKRMPQAESKIELEAAVGEDSGLMVRGFSATFEDGQILVLRSLLDILIARFPLHQPIAKEAIRREDLVLLVRATLTVVLRRDMSLNRRLYTWLLGADDGSDIQLQYFKEHGLDLVVEALRQQLHFSEGTSADQQRPFKILISLLDKTEIGQPIIHSMIMDIFTSLLALRKGDYDHEDFHATANMFFEMTEPYLIWQSLFQATFKDDTSSSLDLLSFVIDYFRITDEEIQRIHLPLLIVVAAQISASTIQSVQSDSSASANRILSQLAFMSDAHSKLNADFLDVNSEIVHEARNQILDIQDPNDPEADPFSFAKAFYRQDGLEQDQEFDFNNFSGLSRTALTKTMFSCLTRLTEDIASGKHNTHTDNIFIEAARLLKVVVDSSNSLGKSPWDATTWLIGVTQLISETANFDVLQSSIEVIVSLVRRTLLLTASVDNRLSMTVLVDKLWSFLLSRDPTHHVESVRLIWHLQSISDHHHIETILSMYVSQVDAQKRAESYEAFGELWRLSEEEFDPANTFSRPLFLILDTLRDHNPVKRRAGETWVRSSLKSYLKVLDPIMSALLSRTILREAMTENLLGVDIWHFEYVRRFDEAFVGYMLESLVTILRFGAGSMLKSTKMTPIRRCTIKNIPMMVDTHGLGYAESSYLEVLTRLATRFLRSEPRSDHQAAFDTLNTQIQIHATDCLHHVVSKGDLDAGLLAEVEEAVTEKLYFAVHHGKIELQTRLLHISHAILSAQAIHSRHQNTKGGHARSESEHPEEHHHAKVDSQFPMLRTHALSPLFVRTLIDGISIHSNRAILQHWMDYLIMSLPRLRHGVYRLVIPLVECICQQVGRGITAVESAVTNAKISAVLPAADVLSEMEFSIFLNGLERLMIFCLTEGQMDHMDASQEADLKGLHDNIGIQGIAGYVTNIFASDPSKSNVPSPVKANDAVLICLQDTVRVLLQIWKFTALSNEHMSSSQSAMYNHLSQRLKARVKKMIDKLYKHQPVDVVETMIEASMRRTYDMTEALLFSLLREITGVTEHITITLLLDSVRSRVPTMHPERFKRSGLVADLSDVELLKFLDTYYAAIDGATAMQVWSDSISFFREFLNNPTSNKHLFAFLLRGMVSLSDKLCQTSFVEDKKVRRDLQDILMKLIDASILVAARSFDSSTWIRRTLKDTDGDSTSPDTPLSPMERSRSDMGPDLEKSITENGGSRRDPFKPRDSIGEQVYSVLAQAVFPNLSRLLIDQDKIGTVCTNVMYYVVSPAFRGRPGVADIHPSILDTLEGMVHINGSLKAWKAGVAEAFGENRFFEMSTEPASKWSIIIRAMISQDREKLVDLLGRVTAASSSALFGNKDLESLNRVYNLRRLTFIVYSGDVDQYLLQLPLIQEKLVELAKLNVKDMTHREIYLCLSVLLMRFSPVHLSNFWPVILTEFFRVLEQFLDDEPADTPEAANVLLSACKFIDLLLVLQIEEFQVHQWIFISDTVDAIYHANEWSPEGMLDRLADVVDTKGGVDRTEKTIQLPRAGELKRPMLTSRRIQSIGELQFFLKHVSLFAYETTYGLTAPDYPFIEQLLLSDMFDSESEGM